MALRPHLVAPKDMPTVNLQTMRISLTAFDVATDIADMIIVVKMERTILAFPGGNIHGDQ